MDKSTDKNKTTNERNTNMKRIITSTLAALALSATLSFGAELLNIDRAPVTRWTLTIPWRFSPKRPP